MKVKLESSLNRHLSLRHNLIMLFMLIVAKVFQRLKALAILKKQSKIAKRWKRRRQVCSSTRS